MFIRTAAFLFSLGVSSVPLAAQSRTTTPAPDLTPNSDISLVAASDGLRSGSTTTVAIRITMDRGWHTYWTNPGDAGLPLTARWTLPAGVTVSSLHFPTPHVLPQPPLMSYGYEDELFALADLEVASSVPTGTRVTLAADVDFLVCAEVCLPASGHVALETRVKPEPRASRWASAISATQARLVRSATGWQTTVWRDGPRVMLMARFPDSLRTVLRAAYVIPDSTDVLEHAAAQHIVISGDTIVMALTAARRLADTASRFTGVLLTDVRAPTIGLQLDAPMLRAPPRDAARLIALLSTPGSSRTGGAAMTVAPDASAAAELGIWFAILLAFVGGVILNLMPCVFPVLSVKVLAVVQRGVDDGGASGRRHALVFTLGVLTTVWALAGALFALRAGGAQLGWGFQLQSPAVVTVLALVVFALALNLSGVFTLGMRLTRLGGMGAGERYSDSFVTGLLAVVVATPCTAPFMGAALGFALTQPVAIGLAVFTSLGLGLAVPYIVFASSPSLLRKLPRSGPWLETLKQLLAFPLYATVVWLLWVLGRQAGADQVAFVLLLAVALSWASWMAGRAQQAGRAQASAISLVLVLLTIAGGGAAIASRPTALVNAAATPPGWEPWSAARVTAARDSGRVVFVDFTAAWCLSCQVNERIALRTDAVERAFASGNVVLLQADWTSRDADITAILSTFGRSGVPLYVVYPKTPSSPPEILPTVLTPGIVVDAITRATGRTLAAAP